MQEMKPESSSEKRYYRNRIASSHLCTFNVMIKETDLYISAKQDLSAPARDILIRLRHQIESYISSHRDFLTTLRPYPSDPLAPEIVRDMIEMGRLMNVGPMASVAGAIAQYVGEELLKYSDEVVVENGGDTYLNLKKDATVSLFLGKSSPWNRLALKIGKAQMPVGVCSSSSKIGHSLSLGKADMVCVVSHSAVLSDAAATSFCNRIKKTEDLYKVESWAKHIDQIIGIIAVLKDKITVWGDVEILTI